MLNQYAKPGRPTKDRQLLSRLQRRRKILLRFAIGFAMAALLFIRSVWPPDHLLHETLESVGLALIAACILGRAWSILYIGGRKAHQLVEVGPYSVSRNPLYLFSFMGALGIGLQSGSLMIGLFCVLGAAAIFVPVVQKEEEVLARTFGETFEDYCQRVPRFGPRLSAWRDAEMVSVAPRLLYLTMRDGLVFVCALPVFELIETMQAMGYLPVLVWLA
jgi:protein-S-isoprenylcysteine O-methyltransferase Ste14